MNTKNNIITISRGPQFRNGKSAPLFVVFVLFLIIDIVLFYKPGISVLF